MPAQQQAALIGLRLASLALLRVLARGFAVLACMTLLLLGYTAQGAMPEYKAKAALIFKIGKFVRWPKGAFSDAHGVLRLCIVGRDDFGASIDSLAGQALQGRIIEVARLSDPQESAADCRIVFISDSERERVGALLNAVRQVPVLTISDIEGFAAQGGMIGLSNTAANATAKARFEINAAASRRAGLEIGAQLLQVATLIDERRTDTAP